MFNIAICDDEETLIDELKENLIKYAAETNKEFCFFIYHDGSVYFKEGIWFCQSLFLYKNSIDFSVSFYNYHVITITNRQYIPVYKGLTVFFFSQVYRGTGRNPLYFHSKTLYKSL